jgi:uncharacterized protein YciI
VYVVAILRMQDPKANRLHRPRHLAYLQDLRAQGKVWANGPFADGAGGMVVYRTSTWEEAQALAQADPLVQTGARSLELHPWEPELPPSP